VLPRMPAMSERAVLLVTVALLSLYVIGIGGATASALGAREAWRRRQGPAIDLQAPEVSLHAPNLPRVFRALRMAGWAAFLPALALGVFGNRLYPWVGLVTVVVMVGLNAFYFSALPWIGERLTLTADGFLWGRRTVRWVHVTDLNAAHAGTFGGIRIVEPGAWQERGSSPNVVLFRLNRALVRPERSLLRRWSGLSYFDGMIRNAFGVPTEQLLGAMIERRRRALEAEGPLFRPGAAGRSAAVRNPEA
jgi:hypothetical protein